MIWKRRREIFKDISSKAFRILQSKHLPETKFIQMTRDTFFISRTEVELGLIKTGCGADLLESN